MTSYATPAELAAFLAPDALPAGAQRVLDRASRDVDAEILTAVYDVDEGGAATDATVVAALREATLEQAAWRLDSGDAKGAAGVWGQVAIGSAQLTRRTDRTAPKEATIGGLCADAYRVLMLAGLTGHEPSTRC
ncbi:hypothetical protein [Actinomadura macra]|uniref:hypothetical protein n=1 Tax=Actinomadura macra TaxID=46164 RepID=UPI00082F73C5|nr:hypothetical protein [Actinomadura macra]